MKNKKRINFYINKEVYKKFLNFLIKKYGSKSFILSREIENAILFYINSINKNNDNQKIIKLEKEIIDLKNEIEKLKKLKENKISINKEEIKKENNFKINSLAKEINNEMNNIPSFLKNNPWIEILQNLPYLNERF
jgi:TolA-binding protein